MIMKSVMKSNPVCRCNGKVCLAVAIVTTLLGFAITGTALGAVVPSVPIRLSFKFILNVDGNRPSTGNLNTDEEVEAQVTRGNQILAAFISELRFETLEIVDLAGVSQWYLAGIDDLGALRDAATGNPTLYRYRNDAINIYITATNQSAIAYYPPNNQMIMCCQGSWQTTVAHEAGHSLNLAHTHDDDHCSDTLPDNESWDQNGIATNAFGLPYSQLTPSQQSQVNFVWHNLMSYHEPNNRSMISPCQMDRQSDQSYNDRNWLLSRIPTYVEAGATTWPWPADMGSWGTPDPTIQAAIDADEVSHRVVVLKAGNHPAAASALSTDTTVVTRSGASVCREVQPSYDLRYDIENSTNAAVRSAVVRAQEFDRQKNVPGVIASLLEAEKHATGREADAIRLELGQRYRDRRNFEEATAWFQRAAERADQPALKARAQAEATVMKMEGARQRK